MPPTTDQTLFRCRCGRTQVYAYRQPAPCQSCRRCGTNLTPAGSLSWRRVAHEYFSEEMVLSEDGALVMTVEVCKFCGRVDDKLPYFTSIR